MAETDRFREDTENAIKGGADWILENAERLSHEFADECEGPVGWSIHVDARSEGNYVVVDVTTSSEKKSGLLFYTRGR